MDDMIIRPYKLDRTKTVPELLEALDHSKKGVQPVVLSAMPTEGPDEGEILFFKPDQCISIGEEITEVEKRGLVPHYLAQLQVNIDDPSFSDDHPNAMGWGFYYHAQFSGRYGVHVTWGGVHWDNTMWFAGIRK